ncbi:TolC family protein [Kerstersia sp.]|uniref:TolC family protein n=1 Tax=Kerstersia sp. TaxID=1930783 RepID=UPI003F916403
MPAPFSARASLGALTLAVLLTGCALRTPYTPPEAAIPGAWQSADAPPVELAAAGDAAGWWQQFQDPLLDRWIADILARNNDLASAGLKTQRARLQAGLSADAMRPALTADASSSLSQDLDHGQESRHSSARLGLSYEWDIWGRLSARDAAAHWEAQAADAEREAVRQGLVVTAASLYWQAGYLNQRLATSQANIVNARKTLKIIDARHRAGAASALDLAEMTRSLAALESTHAQLLQTRDETLRALALLRDAPPSTDLPVPEQLPEIGLPSLAPGLPATLLARRPDVQAAERRLRKSYASADATQADYYPRLSLTGTLGTSSSALLNLLSNPIATLGAGLSLPFLQATEMRLNREIAATDTELAIIGFRQTLYQAFAEVENALSAQTRYATETGQRQLALDAARQTEQLQDVRYQAGAVDLKTLLDAQDARSSSETLLWEAQLNQRINLLKLWQALGGPPEHGSGAV